MKTLHIIRGLPGAGKTCIAKGLYEYYSHKETPTPSERRSRLIEYDEFWYLIGKNEEYQFDESRVWEAHGWFESQVYDAMLRKIHHIVLVNTFITYQEMEPFIALAKMFGYDVQELIVKGPWQSLVEHDVTKERLEEMKKDFEYIEPVKEWECGQSDIADTTICK